MSKTRRKPSPTFIHEFPLCVNRKEEHILLVRLDCARQLYNACLGEALKRLKNMRDSEEWQRAISIPKESIKERRSAFKLANEKYEFSDYSIQAYAVKTKNSCHIGDHLGVHICQKTAFKAFNAVKEYSFKKRGKPRFKGKNQLNSIEGKNNETGVRWIGNELVWDGLRLKPVLDLKDKKGIQAHALDCRVKYVRLVHRVIKGQNKFFVQLVLEGKPLCVHSVGQGVVGLDLGPSSIACVPPVESSKEAFLEPFCKELEFNQKKIRRIQRKIDRSLRATNPEAYDKKGKVKTGTKLNKSKHCLKLKTSLAQEHRIARETRKKLHGTLVNRVFSLGNIVNTEKISYKAWQKLYGKSVGLRGPGMFVSMIRRKAASAGVTFNEIQTWSTRLSQTCHNCGTIKKKPLKQRWHDCECGVHAQRDLYSAFLAQHVVPHTTDKQKDFLDASQAQKAWPGAEPLLESAASRCNQAMSGKQRLSSFGLGQRQNGSRIEEGIVQNDVLSLPYTAGNSGGICNVEIRVLESCL